MDCFSSVAWLDERRGLAADRARTSLLLSLAELVCCPSGNPSGAQVSKLARRAVRLTGPARDLERYVRHCDFERAHIGRRSRGRIPAELDAGEGGQTSRECRHISVAVHP